MSVYRAGTAFGIVGAFLWLLLWLWLLVAEPGRDMFSIGGMAVLLIGANISFWCPFLFTVFVGWIVSGFVPAGTHDGSQRKPWRRVIRIAGRLAVAGLLVFVVWVFIGVHNLSRIPKYNPRAYGDAKNAYTAAQAYFTDNPDGSVSTTDTLSAYGFIQTENVVVIPSGTKGDLTIITYHGSGNRTYTVDSDGAITND